MWPARISCCFPSCSSSLHISCLMENKIHMLLYVYIAREERQQNAQRNARDTYTHATSHTNPHTLTQRQSQRRQQWPLPNSKKRKRAHKQCDMDPLGQHVSNGSTLYYYYFVRVLFRSCEELNSCNLPKTDVYLSTFSIQVA